MPEYHQQNIINRARIHTYAQTYMYYYKTVVIKTLYYSIDRPIGQQNKKENPQINSCVYGQIFFY